MGEVWRNASLREGETPVLDGENESESTHQYQYPLAVPGTARFNLLQVLFPKVLRKPLDCIQFYMSCLIVHRTSTRKELVSHVNSYVRCW